MPKDPKQAAARSVDQLFSVGVQSGAAASISAFGALPEPIQKQQLENDAEGLRQSFALEEKQLAVQERDRAAIRKHELDKGRELRAYQDKREVRMFWLLVGILVVVGGLVVYVFYKERYDIGAPMVTGLLGVGGGWLGGHGQGYKAGQRDAVQAEKEDE